MNSSLELVVIHFINSWSMAKKDVGTRSVHSGLLFTKEQLENRNRDQ